MATLQDALRKGTLEVVPVPSWEPRLPIRALYACPDFLDQIETDAPLHDTKLSIGGLTLYEHLWQRMTDFRCSQRPGSGDLHLVMPVEDSIWKMAPNGLRVFGWAPGPHSLALVNYALASQTHGTSLVAEKRNDVLDFIARHDLAETVMEGGYLEIFPH